LEAWSVVVSIRSPFKVYGFGNAGLYGAQAAIQRAGNAGKVRNILANAPLSTSAVAWAISGAK
jgi:hypothetical protein